MKNLRDLQQDLAGTLAAVPHTPGHSGTEAVHAKQRVAVDGVTHGITGQNFFLDAGEYPAYMKLGVDFIAELRPVGIRETQLAQKIIDTNWRLNTAAVVENNLFHSARLASVRDGDPSDDKTVGMVSKASAWQRDCAGPNCFEKLGRYETRLQRALFKMTAEFERLQAMRLKRGADTFVAAECEAWVWYQTMYALHLQLQARKKDEESRRDQVVAAPATACAAMGSLAASFCKIPESPNPEHPAAASAVASTRPSTSPHPAQLDILKISA